MVERLCSCKVPWIVGEFRRWASLPSDVPIKSGAQRDVINFRRSDLENSALQQKEMLRCKNFVQTYPAGSKMRRSKKTFRDRIKLPLVEATAVDSGRAPSSFSDAPGISTPRPCNSRR